MAHTKLLSCQACRVNYECCLGGGMHAPCDLPHITSAVIDSGHVGRDKENSQPMRTRAICMGDRNLQQCNIKLFCGSLPIC